MSRTAAGCGGLDSAALRSRLDWIRYYLATEEENAILILFGSPHCRPWPTPLRQRIYNRRISVNVKHMVGCTGTGSGRCVASARGTGRERQSMDVKSDGWETRKCCWKWKLPTPRRVTLRGNVTPARGILTLIVQHEPERST